MPISNPSFYAATTPHVPTINAAFANIATLDFTGNAYIGATDGGKLNAMLAQLIAINTELRDNRQIDSAS